MDNTPNQPYKFRGENCVEVNDAYGTYNTNNQSKYKTLMLKASLCDYSDTYVLAKGTISIAELVGNNLNDNNEELVFTDCVAFTDCINQINYTEIDNVRHWCSNANI